MALSITAMLPCFPTAPNRGLIAWRLHQRFRSAFDNRAGAWYGKKEYDKTISDFSEAIRLRPNEGMLYSNRAAIWLDNKRDYDKALSDVNEAIRLNPKHANFYVGRGRVWHEKWEYDKAIADYSKAIELRPNEQHAYLCRAHAWMAKGKGGTAHSDFKEPILLDPKDAFGVGIHDRVAKATIRAPRTTTPFRITPKLFDLIGKMQKRSRDVATRGRPRGNTIKRFPTTTTPFGSIRSLRQRGMGEQWWAATCPDATFRNGKKAIQDATKSCELTAWKNDQYSPPSPPPMLKVAIF